MEIANDEERFHRMASLLYAPVIGDILDELGYCHQFLPPAIQPLVMEMHIVGRAFPGQIGDAWGKQECPFGMSSSEAFHKYGIL